VNKVTVVVIILLALWGILPGLLTVQTSFASAYVFGIPKKVSLFNWRWLQWDRILVWAKNSAIVVIPSTVLSIIVSCMAGYGFAKYEFPGRDALFGLFILAMVVPALILFVPRFVIVAKMGFYNSYIGMILPVILNPAGVFFARQYYKGMGDEILDAARVDGANEWQVFRHIILPISKPLITIVALFAFTLAWGDLLWQLLIAKDANLQTMVVGLATTLRGGETVMLDLGRATAQGIEATISTLVALPPLLLFAAFSKYFVTGLRIQAGDMA
jgi:ABC-type glycerol-3-phosphate transport system permease component